jgi:hypothetical protein
MPQLDFTTLASLADTIVVQASSKSGGKSKSSALAEIGKGIGNAATTLLFFVVFEDIV